MSQSFYPARGDLIAFLWGTGGLLDLGMAALYEGEYAVHIRLAGSGESEDIACGDVPDESPS